ncbi:PIG-L family deacetylase [Herbaspirillum lusitanum]|uniref:PIG-L family deacetylase n=1 Tax=Herbaspirillum lusitanum TaxID=213312 RepID=A0ABW9ADC1_9BURK
MADLDRHIHINAGTAEHLWQASPELAALPPLELELLVPSHSRAVILAPHPDDEVLGCGGLIAQLRTLHREVVLVAVTDGEKSHGPSSALAGALPHMRKMETEAALRCLSDTQIEVMRVGIPDGEVAGRQQQLQSWLQKRLRLTDVVFASWRLDGHPDHEAVGRIGAALEAQLGCKLVEVPIWAWHWAQPARGDLPWARARRLNFDPATEARKRAAIHCFHSQISADPSSGNEPVLPREVLEHFIRPYEVYFT